MSGFYAWCKRPVSTNPREDARLSAEIQTIFLEHRQVYGSPRIHAALQARGVRCGRKRVVRLMQTRGLCAKPHKQRKPMTTNSDPTAHFAPNRLGRDFTANRPNTRWVTDITALPTTEGWLSLAVVLDLFSRMVVGWAMASAENEYLVTLALPMALARRHPQAGLLHHSDRGSEYTSLGYQALLAELGSEVSMSRTANCYDNAAMESFFDKLKSECVNRTHFANQEQARSAIDLRTWNVSTTRYACIRRDSRSVRLSMNRRFHTQ
ncbi:MAG TPA: IS3 family transposase [Ktedonobacteraceae bacterium]|nr:IS3 family transposase [Ktedonobacteraceae bacterium]